MKKAQGLSLNTIIIAVIVLVVAVVVILLFTSLTTGLGGILGDQTECGAKGGECKSEGVNCGEETPVKVYAYCEAEQYCCLPEGVA